MVGLLMKDIIGLRKYMKQVGVAFVLFIILTINMKSPPYLIGMMVMMTSMMVITSISYDEMTKWEKYALTMPILKKDIVLSKYLLLLLTVFLGAGSSLIMATILSMTLKFGQIKLTLLSCGIIMLVAIFFFSLILPIIFKFGPERARILMFIIFAIPSALIIGLTDLMKKLNIPKPSKELIKGFGYASPVIVFLIFIISYRISLSIYNKKEM